MAHGLDQLGSPDPITRAATAVALGLAPRLPRGGAVALGELLEADVDPRVRAGALGALVRAAGRKPARAAWRTATRDPDAAVRRRAAELAPALGAPAPVRAVVALVRDPDPGVAEAAAWALGELGDAARAGGAVPALVGATRGHPDPLVREAAVAALGALGDPRALPAILDACHDRPVDPRVTRATPRGGSLSTRSSTCWLGSGEPASATGVTSGRGP
jgi:HEAT repeat protein